MSVAPEKRIDVISRGGAQQVRGWTGSEFETIRICYNREADSVQEILERVLECQKRDLLDAAPKGQPCACWKCIGLSADPYAEEEPDLLDTPAPGA